MQIAQSLRGHWRSMIFALPLLASCATAGSENYREILTSPNRPDAEKALDAVRKPNEVMAFYQVKKGDKVADIFASRGYYSEILYQLVGTQGIVYSANTSPSHDMHVRVTQTGM